MNYCSKIPFSHQLFASPPNPSFLHHLAWRSWSSKQLLLSYKCARVLFSPSDPTCSRHIQVCPSPLMTHSWQGDHSSFPALYTERTFLLCAGDKDCNSLNTSSNTILSQEFDGRCSILWWTEALSHSTPAAAVLDELPQEDLIKLFLRGKEG